MRSRAAARWRLPSSTTVRNERIRASMPKTDADCASPQSVLGITRPRAGVLPWGELHDRKIYYDGRLSCNGQRLRTDVADAHRIFCDADSRCRGYLLYCGSPSQGT